MSTPSVSDAPGGVALPALAVVIPKHGNYGNRFPKLSILFVASVTQACFLASKPARRPPFRWAASSDTITERTENFSESCYGSDVSNTPDSTAKRRVTASDVADKAGVSISTVSKALSGKGAVRHETRQRVLEVARELKYQNNE